MASQVLARRFSTKLHIKSGSLYSPFPLSRLNHPIDQSLRPKNSVLSSFSSIFNRNYNSTTPYFSNSTNIISKSCIKSSHPWMLCEKVRYFSSFESEDDKKKLLVDNDDELSKQFSSKEGKEFIDKLSKGKYVSSDHQEFVDQLPKDFNDITPEDFCKGSKILVKSLANVSKELTTLGFISIAVAAVTSNNMPQITIPFFITYILQLILIINPKKYFCVAEIITSRGPSSYFKIKFSLPCPDPLTFKNKLAQPGKISQTSYLVVLI